MGAREHQDDGDYAVDALPEVSPTSVDGSQRVPGLFVILLSFAAGISGLLFGCEQYYSQESKLYD